jgi:hypothetical protein
MLLRPLTHALLCTCAFTLCASSALRGQVQVDQPVRLVGATPAQRQLHGLAAPQQEDALARLADLRLGTVQFALVSGTPNAIALECAPPVTAYGAGLLLRFVPVNSNTSTVTLSADGLAVLPLLRPDGAPLPVGALRSGQPTMAQWVDTAFVLLGRAPEDCPAGYMSVNDAYCFSIEQTTYGSFFSAIQECMDKGARLCTWDEYLHACTVLQGQVNGLFDDWEWIDDTSDHTHTGNQAGRWNCTDQRSEGATELTNDFGRARCCYRKR